MVVSVETKKALTDVFKVKKNQKNIYLVTS